MTRWIISTAKSAKTMKTKLYEFDPVVYPFPLIVCKYISKVTAKEISERYNGVMSRTQMATFDEDELRGYPTLTAKTLCVVDKKTEFMKYMVILYRPKKIRYGVIAHEDLHVVTLLCDWLGIRPPQQSDDEPHAYLIQWVANCIGSVLDGRPEVMKGKLLNQDKNESEKTESNAGGQE